MYLQNYVPELSGRDSTRLSVFLMGVKKGLFFEGIKLKAGDSPEGTTSTSQGPFPTLPRAQDLFNASLGLLVPVPRMI